VRSSSPASKVTTLCTPGTSTRIGRRAPQPLLDPLPLEDPSGHVLECLHVERRAELAVEHPQHVRLNSVVIPALSSYAGSSTYGALTRSVPSSRKPSVSP